MILNNKNSVLEKYYGEYFAIEDQFFTKRSQIYLDILKEKLEQHFKHHTKKGDKKFTKVFSELKDEKIEQYLNFVK